MSVDEPGALVLPTLAAVIVGACLAAGLDHPVELALLSAMAAVGVAWILVLAPPRER